MIVNCKLAGEDGNAFATLSRFRGAARRAGWKEAEIRRVPDEAMGRQSQTA